MAQASVDQRILEPEEREFYCRTLAVLEPTGIEVLIGGAYAFARYTGIERHTKDLDIFVRPSDFTMTLKAGRLPTLPGGSKKAADAAFFYYPRSNT